ncbi:hypothetical protein LTR70_008976 [Exophiala xenobiotica]|uniref:Patatin-like phospholipase domain-containing protein n=1 Tax=Lithohypha guttulata TaxID=1690604 RepID=A0ABR0JZ94_9EURO|nr:hypothetical protein LTR24_008712 [Lithohypha guttulata]KAK5311174.1 hypothetical protein LTR70_008976 [Exophiala xenobiotica]
MAHTGSPTQYNKDTFDPEDLPDYHDDFISQEDLNAFAAALEAPTTNPVIALNDWKPIHQKIKKPRLRKKARRKDETREGFVYTLLRYPILLGVLGWVAFLFIVYNITRLYISSYEVVAGWRGRRNNLRHELQRADSYEEWQRAAERLDAELGNEEWKQDDEYSYYNSLTVSRVTHQLSDLRQKVIQENLTDGKTEGSNSSIGDLKALLESCIKNNFVGVENSHLYSETYIGTKYLVQRFIDEVAAGVQMVLDNQDLSPTEKTDFFRFLELNYGRTALCLSGGATFAYYHFGVIRALLDAGDLPQIITGTSGGALVAALVGTRTEEELKKLVVPALAHRIRACNESWWTWSRRWWWTGARFDSLDWAKKSSWFCRGSMTFREAYERTGRILNVSCVPSDPHSPTMLNNHITSPDCVIWSAVLASAAVPGILNPIVLMRKNKDGTLSPYSFGHKWKDGSLRTDIPLKQLNIHFNVNFSIVSQVNPHINLFFFSPRGLPGSPVRHRKGRGWRGGFLGSSIETSVKLDLQKYMKILRHLELLPRPMGQDWSEIWLQRFSGTVTVWPKSILSDYWNILSDPSTERLARMIRVGERSCWPRIRFIDNRFKLERVILEGLRRSIKPRSGAVSPNPVQEQQKAGVMRGLHDKLFKAEQHDSEDEFSAPRPPRRQSSILQELERQAAVLWEDPPSDGEEDGTTTTDDEGSDALAHNLAVEVNFKQE